MPPRLALLFGSAARGEAGASSDLDLFLVRRSEDRCGNRGVGRAVAGAPNAIAAVSDTMGKTTLEQRVVPAAPGTYRFPRLGAGEPYTVRQELGTAGRPGPPDRTSLLYLGQLSDFQLADEESPARLEVIDPLSTPLSLPVPFFALWAKKGTTPEARGPERYP